MKLEKVVLYQLKTDLELEAAKAICLPIMLKMVSASGAHIADTSSLTAERVDDAWHFSMRTITLLAPRRELVGRTPEGEYYPVPLSD